MRIQNTLLVMVLYGSLAVVLSGCGQSSQADSQAIAAAPEVTIVSVTPKAVTLTTALPGRTSAFLVSEVRPQVGGIIQKRLFTEGTDVKAGEVLYQIDPATYQAAYDNARAAQVKAEANALPARLKAERYANLAQVRAVSKQDNDDAQAAHKQAEAEILATRAAEESARISLSYTRVTAPISGRIGKSAVTPGALVTASQATPLATVQQIDSIYVDVTQSSAELLRLKRDLASGKLRKDGEDGAKVKLLYEDGTAYPEEGVLQFSDITVDQSTGVVTLRALFPNPRHDLLPGLYVRAVLEEGVDENGILVPQAAVSRDVKGDPQVLVVKADDTVELRPIRVDRAVGPDWLVRDGLAAGDRVILEGLQKVRPGIKVKVVEAAPAGQPRTVSAQPHAAVANQDTGTPRAPAVDRTRSVSAPALPAAEPAAPETVELAKPLPSPEATSARQ